MTELMREANHCMEVITTMAFLLAMGTVVYIVLPWMVIQQVITWLRGK